MIAFFVFTCFWLYSFKLARPYIERAFNLYIDLQNVEALVKAKNNLVDAYRRIEKYPEANDLLKDCIVFNRQHHPQ